LDTSFGTAVLKAQKVFTGSRSFYRQSAFKTACKANRLPNQHAFILIRLRG
jgi:hypothetical protein